MKYIIFTQNGTGCRAFNAQYNLAGFYGDPKRALIELEKIIFCASDYDFDRCLKTNGECPVVSINYKCKLKTILYPAYSGYRILTPIELISYV